MCICDYFQVSLFHFRKNRMYKVKAFWRTVLSIYNSILNVELHGIIVQYCMFDQTWKFLQFLGKVRKWGYLNKIE